MSQSHSVFYYESHVETLQRDAEIATKEYQKAQREETFLDEQIAEAVKELTQAKRRCTDKSPTLGQDIRNVKRKLMLESKGCNEEQNLSTQLRKQIEVYRLEKNHYQKTIDQLSNEIKRVRSLTGNQRSYHLFDQKSEERLRHKAWGLQKRKSENKQHFSFQMKKLNDILKEERENRKASFKQFTQGFSQRFKNEIEGLSLGWVLQRLRNKWKSKVSSKKKILDRYVHRIQLIKDAFKDISSATGIKTLDNLVTSVIKSEEQIHKLKTYIEDMSHEMVLLENSTLGIQNQISGYSDSIEQGREELSLQHRELSFKQENLEMKMENFEIVGRKIHSSLGGATQWVEKIQALLDKTPFEKISSPLRQGKHLLDVNTEDVTLTLAAIEQNLANLLISFAYHNQEPSPFLKTLPLKSLQSKSFLKNPYDIRAMIEDESLINDVEFTDKKEPCSTNEFAFKAIQILSKGHPEINLSTFGRSLTPI